MSKTVRWILAILLIVAGVALAAFAVFGGAFSTVACVTVPPDWVYYFLIFVGVINIVAGVVPAVMLLREAKGSRIVTALVVGVIFACLGYSAYLALLGQFC
jgi:hypothetical protein